MFNMVEEIDDGKSKLLFLTNPQAELIASSSESVQKMLDALEVCYGWTEPMTELVYVHVDHLLLIVVIVEVICC